MMLSIVLCVSLLRTAVRNRRKMLIPMLLLLTVVGLLYFYLTKNYGYWKQRNIQGPTPKLFVGNFPSIYNKSVHLKDEVTALYRKYKGKTPFVGIFNGVQPHMMIFEPEMVKKVLITNFTSFGSQAMFPDFDETHDPLAGRNPFFLKGEKWKQKRNEITPAFSTGRIKALWPIMTEVSERMRKYLVAHQTDSYVEAREVTAKFTTDVVASAIYGVEGGSFTDTDSVIRKLARDVMSPSWRVILISVLQPALPIIAKIFKVRFVAEDKANFLIDLLNQTLKYRKDNNVQRSDFVDYLIHLREKNGLADIEIAAHTVTFFFDGIETSSITMSYIYYELAKNQRVQEKLRHQLLDIKRKKGTLSYEDVYDHAYLDQIVFETMRLNTVMPFLSRLCSDDIEMTFSDGQRFKFEKGVAVTIPVRDIQTDPEYYDNPNEFIPERFDEDNGGMKVFRDQGVLFPFGDGPRVCLGQRFALAQMKCCIANIVTQFKIAVSPEMPKEPKFDPMEMMIVYKGGIRLKFEPIES